MSCGPDSHFGREFLIYSRFGREYRQFKLLILIVHLVLEKQAKGLGFMNKA